MSETTVATQDEYKDRYVAFLDLLGFKALVCAAENDESEHSRLREVLERLNQTLCNNSYADFASRISPIASSSLAIRFRKL